jgi:hypothetical protein
MRLPEVSLLLIASLGLSGCVDSLRSQQPPTKWTTGFWFWRGSSIDTTRSSESLDVIFIHVGTISKDDAPYVVRQATSPRQLWHAYAELPDQFPEAREYWLVFRFERQGVPDLPAAAIVAEQVAKLRKTALKEHLNVVGVQLDIDSPTGALPQYVSFLREVRKGLPQGFEISITALLDWFRNGTAIAEVIKEVDEFVPQFYDVADFNNSDGGGAIAAKIDAKRWGPVFNRFGKRFRIGISTFGRARLVPREDPSQPNRVRYVFFRDLTPLDIAANSAFHVQATRSPANELVLSYRVARKTRIGYNDLEAGDTIQFILSTPEAIGAAVGSAKRMRGHLAGVVFFRWPSLNESLPMPPDEALIAAGLTAQDSPKRSSILRMDGGCAAVKCMDLFLENANPFSPQLSRYRIRGSTELEYFLPENNMPIRMVGSSELELSLPPYCGRARMYIGRAVTANPAEFTVEEQ